MIVRVGAPAGACTMRIAKSICMRPLPKPPRPESVLMIVAESERSAASVMSWFQTAAAGNRGGGAAETAALAHAASPATSARMARFVTIRLTTVRFIFVLRALSPETNIPRANAPRLLHARGGTDADGHLAVRAVSAVGMFEDDVVAADRHLADAIGAAIGDLNFAMETGIGAPDDHRVAMFAMAGDRTAVVGLRECGRAQQQGGQQDGNSATGKLACKTGYHDEPRGEQSPKMQWLR